MYIPRRGLPLFCPARTATRVVPRAEEWDGLANAQGDPRETREALPQSPPNRKCSALFALCARSCMYSCPESPPATDPYAGAAGRTELQRSVAIATH